MDAIDPKEYVDSLTNPVGSPVEVKTALGHSGCSDARVYMARDTSGNHVWVVRAAIRGDFSGAQGKMRQMLSQLGFFTYRLVDFNDKNPDDVTWRNFWVDVPPYSIEELRTVKHVVDAILEDDGIDAKAEFMKLRPEIRMFDRGLLKDVVLIDDHGPLHVGTIGPRGSTWRVAVVPSRSTGRVQRTELAKHYPDAETAAEHLVTVMQPWWQVVLFRRAQDAHLAEGDAVDPKKFSLRHGVVHKWVQKNGQVECTCGKWRHTSTGVNPSRIHYNFKLHKKHAQSVELRESPDDYIDPKAYAMRAITLRSLKDLQRQPNDQKYMCSDPLLIADYKTGGPFECWRPIWQGGGVVSIEFADMRAWRQCTMTTCTPLRYLQPVDMRIKSKEERDLDQQHLLGESDEKDQIDSLVPSAQERDWPTYVEKRDPHGQVKRLYTHKTGKASFKLLNTFFGNDEAKFDSSWLESYSVYVYDEQGEFVDGDNFDADTLEGAVALAARFAVEMLTEYSPTLLRESWGDDKETIDAEAAKAEKPASEEQAEAGNYKKGHVSFQGIPIAIENAMGSTRSGTNKHGKSWSVTMPAHYGYVKKSESKDGDAVDVYIGESPSSMLVFVINQKKEDTGAFDEHKCMLGFKSKDEAIGAYDAAFSGDLGPKLRGEVISCTVDQFKEWLKKGNTEKPFKLEESEDIDATDFVNSNAGAVHYAYLCQGCGAEKQFPFIDNKTGRQRTVYYTGCSNCKDSTYFELEDEGLVNSIRAERQRAVDKLWPEEILARAEATKARRRGSVYSESATVIAKNLLDEATV